MASIVDGIQATLDEVLFARLLLTFESVLGPSPGIPKTNGMRGHVGDETTISGADAG